MKADWDDDSAPVPEAPTFVGGRMVATTASSSTTPAPQVDPAGGRTSDASPVRILAYVLLIVVFVVIGIMFGVIAEGG